MQTSSTRIDRLSGLDALALAASRNERLAPVDPRRLWKVSVPRRAALPQRVLVMTVSLANSALRCPMVVTRF